MVEPLCGLDENVLKSNKYSNIINKNDISATRITTPLVVLYGHVLTGLARLNDYKQITIMFA